MDEHYNRLKTETSHLYRKMVHINCWHINDQESLAMWDLYVKSNPGVAIKTRYGNLKEAIENDKNIIFFSRVYYLDYEKSYIPESCLFNEFLCKRGHYSHERELRGLLLKGYDLDKFSDSEIRGTNVATDLNILIDSIVLKPGTSEETLKEIHSIISSNGFEFRIERSELEKQPSF